MAMEAMADTKIAVISVGEVKMKLENTWPKFSSEPSIVQPSSSMASTTLAGDVDMLAMQPLFQLASSKPELEHIPWAGVKQALLLTTDAIYKHWGGPVQFLEWYSSITS